MIKDNSGRTIIITAIIMIILQGANLVGVAVNRKDISQNNKTIATINREYAPMIFLEGMAQNNNYQTQELLSKTSEVIATLTDEKELVEKYQKETDKIREKYINFQRIMINQMIEIKKATSSQTRSAESKK